MTNLTCIWASIVACEVPGGYCTVAVTVTSFARMRRVDCFGCTSTDTLLLDKARFFAIPSEILDLNLFCSSVVMDVHAFSRPIVNVITRVSGWTAPGGGDNVDDGGLVVELFPGDGEVDGAGAMGSESAPWTTLTLLISNTTSDALLDVNNQTFSVNATAYPARQDFMSQ